ncbi:LMBR1 domain-containing protein 2 homolog [Culicoides brevitarsis]|uniref:LMBR1 domain-containing protein 2 homolog n=1 Tax=Culicoides brevitarsis TaxID=469753 RepID=UPI00307CC63C
MVYLLVFSICFAVILALVALYRYGKIQTQHLIVSFSVMIAWSFSFMIVFTIPLDVTSTVYRQCKQEHNISIQVDKIFNSSSNIKNETGDESSFPCQKPWGMVSDEVFPKLWRIIYWSTQFLTWLIMPMMQSYLKAGDFNVKRKLKAALIDNVIYYGSYLFICGILLLDLALNPKVYLDWPKLKAIASSASNTWGLFLLILLLGYGLVETPRSFWNNAKPGYSLNYAYFKLSKLYTEKVEAEENVDDVLESLQAANHAIPNHHDQRPNIETILKKVPTELLDKAERNVRRDDSPSTVPSEKALTRIHKLVIKSLQTLQRAEALWNIQVNKVLHLEDIARNMNSVDRHFKSEFTKNRSKFVQMIYTPKLEWYWECFVKPPCLKVLCFITAFLSFLVVWSEITFFSREPVLSFFALLLEEAKGSYNFVQIELLSMITLCYLCYCAYSTVFRIKFLNLYYLAPHHQTNEHSLLFSGMLLSRLTPPLCLNFLCLVHMDSHILRVRIQETAYTQVMGHMDVLGIISDGFNIYFPLFLLAFCLATYFRSLGGNVLNALGFQQFIENETIVAEFIQEGKDLMTREKRKRQRAEEASNRRRDNRDRSMRDLSSSIYGRSSVFREPGDGLLRDNNVIDYSTTSDIEMRHSLSDEIHERFGISTQICSQPTIEFRGYETATDEDEEKRNIGPPRGLFDDV